MAALTSIASLAGAGATIYAQRQQVERAKDNQRAQAAANAQQDAQRQQQLAIAQQAEQRTRSEQVARTIASTRARIAAGGISPDEGSAAALTTGLAEDAAAGQADSDALFRARLSAGRASLLNSDGSLTSWVRSIPTFGNALRNLLD
jgi:hypothetical protein